MDHNEQDILLIDRYINNDLSDAEFETFKQRLSDDINFEEEYLQRKAIQINFRKDKMEEKLKMLEKLEQTKFDSTDRGSQNTALRNIPMRRKIIFALSAAAAIALVISIFFPFWAPSGPYDNLFEEHFEGYLSHVIKRGTSQNIDKLKSKAYALYEIGQYEKAAPLLENIAKEGDVSSYLYAAIAYTGYREHEKALELLRIYTSNTEELRDAANLYTAINKMMLGEMEEALIIFTTLSSRTGFIGNKAKVFLEGMEK